MSGEVLTIGENNLVTSVGPNLKLLAEEVEKLDILLQDQQPGLSTWETELRNQGNKVLGLLKDLGFTILGA